MPDEYDPYLPSGSYVLRNRLNITDQKKLDRAETRITSLRLAELQLRPEHGAFDADHLKRIHRRIFGDIYSWAGEFRVLDIAKGDTLFGHFRHIGSFLDESLRSMRQDPGLARGADPAVFASRLAQHFADLNAAHPFREGNGRTQREFLREFSLERGFTLSFRGVSHEAMTQASILAMNGKLEPIAAIIHAGLSPVRTRERAREPRNQISR